MEKIAIVGLGGVGKTQVSLELAFQAKEMYPDCAVFWVPTVDMESVQQAYQLIASKLGIGNPDSDEEDVRRVVQMYLSKPQSGRWLLIFDNADDLSMWKGASWDSKDGGLRDFLPQSEQGVIMFTTRSNKVAQYLKSTETIEIPEMDEHKATQVLSNLLINKNLLSDKESTRKLLERLTFLPLAIVQAASFINENMMDISSYARLLDGQAQDIIDLLSQEFEDEGRYKSIRNPVATTWLTSFDQIRRQSAVAFNYLAFMACVNQKDIPISILPLATPLERGKALGLLISYSFVRSHHAGSRLDMHRLVQLATTNWLKSIDSLQIWHSYALQHLSWCYPQWDKMPPSEIRAAMPHVLQVLRLTSNKSATPERAQLLSTVGTYKADYGRYKEALEVLAVALDIWEPMFGRDDFRSLSTLKAIGFVHRQMDNLEKAAQIFEEILDLQKCKLGLDCAETSATMIDLASVYRHRGAPGNSMQYLQKAEELNTRAARYCLKVMGPEHPDTLCALFWLTQTYTAQGRLSNAEELAKQFLAIQTRVAPAGLYDFRTARAMSALADIYFQRWRLKDAEALYSKSMEREKKIVGPEHPTVLRSMYQLARVLKSQRRHSEAVDLMTECARLDEKLFGASHYATIQCFDYIKDWTNWKYVVPALTLPLICHFAPSFCQTPRLQANDAAL